MQFHVREIITGVTVTPGVTLISLRDLPTGSTVPGQLFSLLAEDGIHVDMISLSARGVSGLRTLRFSAADEDLPVLLASIGKLRTLGELLPEVDTGNCRITLSGEKMKFCCGTAAFVFGVFADFGIDLKLITTSETRISCLVDGSRYSAALEVLERGFGIKAV